MSASLTTQGTRAPHTRKKLAEVPEALLNSELASIQKIAHKKFQEAGLNNASSKIRWTGIGEEQVICLAGTIPVAQQKLFTLLIGSIQQEHKKTCFAFSLICSGSEPECRIAPMGVL